MRQSSFIKIAATALVLGMTLGMAPVFASNSQQESLVVDDSERKFIAYGNGWDKETHTDNGYKSTYRLNGVAKRGYGYARWISSTSGVKEGDYNIHVTWVVTGEPEQRSDSLTWYFIARSPKGKSQRYIQNNFSQKQEPQGPNWGGRPWESLKYQKDQEEYGKGDDVVMHIEEGSKIYMYMWGPANKIFTADAVRLVPVNPGPVCGDGIIQPGETCDGDNWGKIEECTDLGDFTGGELACGRDCKFDTLQCTIAQDELTRLDITVKSTGTTDTAVVNQKDITLLRFEASTDETEDVLLTEATFAAQMGSLYNGQNYALWVDTDYDDSVDTILENGVVSPMGQKIVFSELAGGGYVVPDDKIVTFEVHMDVASSLTDDVMQLQFHTVAEYLRAEERANGTPLVGIDTNGSCNNPNDCQIHIKTQDSILWNFASQQGNLYVTQSNTPLRSRQLLGGDLREAILRLTFRAANEAVDVTDLQISSVHAQARSIDRLELYKDGESTPFALATVGGCGSDITPAGHTTFCANMESRQLVVPEGGEVDVQVRPRIKTDVAGGIRGEEITLCIEKRPVADQTTGEGAVRARGDMSSNELDANDEDSTAEGEIFIGTNSAGPNQDIVGNENHIVMSKIESITNANPAQDGSPVPLGPSNIGQFKFAVADHNNSKNGLNKVVLSDFIFNVNATNVEVQADSFTFYNEANSATKHACEVYLADGTHVPSGSVSGTLYAECDNMNQTPAEVAIDQGTFVTVVLEASITDPNTSVSGERSTLQVSLSNFDNISYNKTFGINESHVQWMDRDADAKAFQWIEYPITVIRSTAYSG